MKFKVKIGICLLALATPVICFGDPHYVSLNGANNTPFANWADAATNIQMAVNVAANGETVYVTNNTIYLLTNQVIITNAITVRSWVADGGYDPTTTILNGNSPSYTNRVMFVSNTLAAIQGLTISNGFTTNFGGGIYNYGGTVSNCIIVNNVSTTNGGGVYTCGGNLLNCIIASNTAYSGGGVFGTNGCQVWGSIISNNTASDRGGGIYCAVSSKTNWIIQSTIVGNVAAGYGGAGCYLNNYAIASNCDILYNDQARYYGGGVYLYGADCSLLNSRIIGNRAGGGGSGGGVIAFTGGNIESCIISSNRAPYGGGVYVWTTGKLKNCLVSENMATNNIHTSGGGVNIRTNGSVINCTIVRNTSQNSATLGGGGGLACGTAGGVGAAVYIANTIIYFNTSVGNTLSNWFNAANWQDPASYSNCCSAPALTFGTNNISSDPLLNTLNGNDHLTKSSPCINAGVNQTWMTGASDLDGRCSRIDRFFGKVDMGAYEYLLSGTMLSGH